jgi:hypothetical protein
MPKYILLFVFSISLFACRTTKDLKQTTQSLIDAHIYKNELLVNGDTKKMKKVIHKDLLYKHSNCWEEDFDGFLDNEHVLDYKAINIETVNSRIISNVGIVNGVAEFDIIYKGKEMQLWLCYLEHYLWKDGKWILISRHASKDSRD